ncbi:MAG: hypothetical protein ACRDTQ_17090 [Micromonosporaceae bacterium]
MAALNGDDEPRRPPSPDSIVSLPPPWGDVVIPDDVSALDDVAAQVRRQLRREASPRHAARAKWWSGRRDASGRPGILGPALVVFLAMTLALVSLFGGVWPALPDGKGSPSRPRAGPGNQLPDLTLADRSGAPVRLRDTAPSIILSLGGCACVNLIKDAAAVAERAGVSLVAIGRPTAPTAPAITSGNPEVRTLADPRGAFTKAVAPPPRRPVSQDSALVVLLAGDGAIREVKADVKSAEEFATGAQALR